MSISTKNIHGIYIYIYHYVFFSTKKVYDVSSFLSKHPGGVQQIMSGLGNDITQVFDSYHKRQTFERYIIIINLITFFERHCL